LQRRFTVFGADYFIAGLHKGTLVGQPEGSTVLNQENFHRIRRPSALISAVEAKELEDGRY
jgi:hypothetical protein